MVVTHAKSENVKTAQFWVDIAYAFESVIRTFTVSPPTPSWYNVYFWPSLKGRVQRKLVSLLTAVFIARDSEDRDLLGSCLVIIFKNHASKYSEIHIDTKVEKYSYKLNLFEWRRVSAKINVLINDFVETRKLVRTRHYRNEICYWRHCLEPGMLTGKGVGLAF